MPRGVEGERLVGWAEEQERGLGGHAVTLSVGWDEWRNGGRERVQGLLEREVRRREVAELGLGVVPARVAARSDEGL